MADEKRRRTVIAGRHQGSECVRTRNRLFRGFDTLMPPLPRQMREVMMRESGRKHIGRTADVANKSRPLANLVHNVDRHSMTREDRLCGLQGARVGRNDDPGQRCAGEPRRSRSRLLSSKRRQFRILDPRIYASLAEMEVKIALPVAEQNMWSPSLSMMSQDRFWHRMARLHP